MQGPFSSQGIEKGRMKKKAWHMEEFNAAADKTLRKYRKQVNFSAKEDKNKKAKQES